MVVEITLIDPNRRVFECNCLWVLKTIIRSKREKSHRVRMPYKRSSRISRHFWSPDFTRITDQKELFQQPRLISTSIIKEKRRSDLKG
jgi:hypothetical protein